MKLKVSHIAKLTNLPLNDKEIEKFGPQLESTLKYIGLLNEIDTKDVEPTSQVTGLKNITRNDEINKSLTQEQALSNTKIHHNGAFKVDAILENQ